MATKKIFNNKEFTLVYSNTSEKVIREMQGYSKRDGNLTRVTNDFKLRKEYLGQNRPGMVKVYILWEHDPKKGRK